MPPPEKKKKPASKKKDCDCDKQGAEDAFSPAQARDVSMLPEDGPMLLDPETNPNALRLLYAPTTPPWHAPWQYYPPEGPKPIPNWEGGPPQGPAPSDAKTQSEADLERIKQGLPLEPELTLEEMLRRSPKEMY